MVVDELKQSVEKWSSVSNETSFLESLEIILLLRNTAREQYAREQNPKLKYDESQWNNSEYKNIEILPRWNEISCVPQRPHLRENIIIGISTLIGFTILMFNFDCLEKILLLHCIS